MGLKTDQILSIIVPIAMISFGVDVAFHAVGRYREELAHQSGSTPDEGPRWAMVAGLGGVLGALLLALASDAAAFLSNAVSGIESLIQFGIGASLALVAAFVMLGVATPLALMRLEQRAPTGALHSALQSGSSAPRVGADPPRSVAGRLLAVAGAVLAALGAMACVTVSVFVLPWLGVLLLLGYLLVFILLPALLCRSTARPAPHSSDAPPRAAGVLARWTGVVVAGLPRFRVPLLLAVLVVTSVCVVYATRVQVSFEVKDFFAADTDFVVGLEKYQRSVGQLGGEPAFAVHFTMRYREELARHPTRIAAMTAAGAGTGGALVASALSSVVGFAILALAPMPMFAAYGLLTAIMILLAAVASLLVLPSLLMLVTRDG